MVRKYDFYKTKYGTELLVDLIRLETLEKYILNDYSHILTYYDITLILNGNGHLYLDNYVSEIKKNTIICSSPFQVRQWKINNIPSGLVLIFEEEFLSVFFNDTDFVKKLNFFHTILNKPELILSDSETLDFKTILLNIEKEILETRDKNEHIIRALLYQALAWLNREYAKHIGTESCNNDISNRFINLVKEHYNKAHSVNFYAEKLHITPGYLNELIQKNIRISAKQYIKNRIFLEAKRLLCNSSLSISEIAWKLNFDDVSYFTRAFKKSTGYSPKTYRTISVSQKVPL